MYSWHFSNKMEQWQPGQHKKKIRNKENKKKTIRKRKWQCQRQLKSNALTINLRKMHNTITFTDHTHKKGNNRQQNK